MFIVIYFYKDFQYHTTFKIKRDIFTVLKANLLILDAFIIITEVFNLNVSQGTMSPDRVAHFSTIDPRPPPPPPPKPTLKSWPRALL